MSIIKSITRKFVESQARYDMKKARISLVLLALVGCLAVFQAEWIVGWIGRRDVGAIRKDMEIAEAVQSKLRNSFQKDTGKALPSEIEFHYLFNEKQLRMLNAAKSDILNDKQFQRTLEGLFGTCFFHVMVVIVPGWEMNNSLNYAGMGFSNEAGAKASVHVNDPNIEGFTVRDLSFGQMQKTIDGTPRIVLNLGAFKSTAILRLTLFHELLHALNIPAHDPLGFMNQWQNDLTYLPQYRQFVSKSGWDGWRQPEITVLILALWITFAWVLVRSPRGTLLIFRRRRSDRRPLQGMDEVITPPPDQQNVEDE